ncbi:KilA-N domain-containing protein [Enterobacter hormaechei]|uniref:KilA-N domain-containing protein n=1 Tax=Enterobacter hormaechei TaxID=158836 RepID=UPI00079178CD|nr:KilA-N domain-containing protein [Enterobacter hormaechei]CZY57948.1 ORF45 [Enterobacter hormaechei]CZY64426.1 ORF45 [Enterobacter hormaechei]CZY73500.1 ORF45 [Enterobacter hormaechei]SAF35748.1 ORF45 [Enterobacter hormaechei]
MNSLAKSTVNCTNSIIISDIKIHMDTEGRYSLNDLHKAAGSEQKHKPVHWLATSQTKELIEEILKVGILTFKPTDIKKGRYGGTYVCKELVYSYAMWISAAFALKVIRAYDALVTGNANEAVRIAKTTVSERTPLRDAVNMLVGKKGLRYDDAYNMVHQRFGVDSIDELSIEQIPQAVEYIHRVVLEGEYLGKQEHLPATTLDINYPSNWWLKTSIAVQKENAWAESDGVINMSLMVLKRKEESALGRILFELKNHGYNVEAAYLELNAMKHHLELSTRFIETIQEKSYQAIHRGFHSKM